MGGFVTSATAVLVSIATLAIAQAACPSTLTPRNGAPVAAAGYQARLIANGLTKPRGLVFDSVGHLLVVQNGAGIASLTLQEDDMGCVSLAEKATVALTLGVGVSYLFPAGSFASECYRVAGMNSG